MGWLDEQVLVALVMVAVQLIAQFDAQTLANTAWAFTTVDRSDELLFLAMAKAAEWRMGEFSMQGLANAV